MREPSARIKSMLFMAVFVAAFWAYAPSSLADEPPHERVIHLKGTTNSRDIGGYQTGGLGVLRWGEVIRSDELSRLAPGDFQKLEAMGLKTVIDLCTRKEHDESPTRWQGDHPPRFYHFPVGDSHDEWFTAQHNMMKTGQSPFFTITPLKLSRMELNGRVIRYPFNFRRRQLHLEILKIA